MAYTPINWQTGQTITAEKLNKMDNGWSVEATQLFSETVTTVDDEGDIFATLQYAEYINYDSITVVFNGQSYECAKTDVDGTSHYGGLSEYPFDLQSDPAGANTILTETAGTYTVAASVKSVETSTDFGKARGYWESESTQEFFSGSITTTDGNNRQATITETPEFASAATLKVTLDNVEYNLTGFNDGGYWTWGAPDNDFSEYSFSISIDSGNGSAIFLSQVAGTYSLIIQGVGTVVDTSPTFRSAVYGFAPATQTTISTMSIAYGLFYNVGAITIPAHGSVSASLTMPTMPSGWQQCERYMVANVRSSNGAINLANWSISSNIMTATVQNISDSSVTLQSTTLQVDAYGFTTAGGDTIYYLSGRTE